MRPAQDADPLDTLRRALADLAAAQEWRALAETWSASGLVDPRAGQRALDEAERNLRECETRVRQARGAAERVPLREGRHAWGAH